MTSLAQSLAKTKCQACAPGTPKLSEQRIGELLAGLEGCEHKDGRISKTYRFGNYHETMAFVNAVAWIAHRQDHHPDMEVGYNKCIVHYSTHSVGGLSENDFICAAKVEALWD